MTPSRLLPQFVAVAVLAGSIAPSSQAAPLDGPRPAGAVVDTAGALDAESAARLERLAAGIRRSSGADLVVVLIPTTLGRPPRAFATDLFNRWEVGSRERNDGLLIFAALDDRRAEIILGAGVDSPEQVAASRRIMEEVMRPEFKRGRPGAGVLRAAFACAAEILGAGGEEEPPEIADPAADVQPAGIEVSPRPLAHLPPMPAGQPADGGLTLALGGGGAVGGIGLGWYLLRRRLRNRPRICPHCRIDMQRLGEVTDDAHLAAGQQLEERLRSVDYDVWTCPTCPHVQTVRYGAFFTAYARCPRCRFVTKSSTVNRVRSPTTWSTGLEQITERCSQCGYAAQSTRVIPRIDDSASSRSGSSGGGRSSGAGASGSW